jgi:hypothetical protein
MVVLPEGVVIDHVFVASSTYGDLGFYRYTEAQAVAKGAIGVEEQYDGTRKVQIFRSLVEVVLKAAPAAPKLPLVAPAKNGWC